MERKEGGAGREWKTIQEKLDHWNKMLPFLDDSERMIDNTILSLTQTGQEKWRVRPHEELVHDIEATLITQRMNYDSKGVPFDPVEWTRKHLTSLSFTIHDTDRNDPNASSVVNRQVLDLCRAFQSISLPYMRSHEYKNNISALLRAEATSRKGHIIHLAPDALRLLDALPGAIGVPHFKHASDIDLLIHARQYEPLRSENTSFDYDVTTLPKTQGNLVCMRNGYLIDRGKDYPSTMTTVFVGDIRFTRGTDDLFRADTDEDVRNQE